MPVLRPVRSAPPAASRLAAILRRIAGGGLADLPVDVELWDGSVLPAGAPGGSAGRIRVGRRALAYLLDEPNQLGLSRAYVAGELGFDGDLSALLAERARFASVRPSARDLALATAAAVLTAGPDVLAPPARARERGPAARPPPLAGARPRRRPPPLRRLQRLLPPAARPEPRLLVRVLRRPGRHARGGAGAQARARLPQAAPRRGRAAPRHRLRLGLAADPRGAPPRRAAPSAITLSEAQAALARAARRARRGSATASRSASRLPRHRRRAVRQDRERRHGRARRRGAARRLRRDARAARCARAASSSTTASPASSPSPRDDKSLIQRYVFPDGELPPVADVVGALPRPPASRPATSSRSASTTR